MANLQFWSDRSLPRSFQNDWLHDVWGFLNEADLSTKTETSSTLSVACDITESENSYHLNFDVPGIKESDLNIEVTGKHLVVSGERHFKKETEDTNVYRLERKHGKFQRSFELPEGVNTDSILASYENGVLAVTVPKSEVQKTKKISIGSTSKSLLENLTGKKPKATKVVNS